MAERLPWVVGRRPWRSRSLLRLGRGRHEATNAPRFAASEKDRQEFVQWANARLDGLQVDVLHGEKDRDELFKQMAAGADPERYFSRTPALQMGPRDMANLDPPLGSVEQPAAPLMLRDASNTEAWSVPGSLASMCWGVVPEGGPFKSQERRSNVDLHAYL